jgi:acid phosphatase (class A)
MPRPLRFLTRGFPATLFAIALICGHSLIAAAPAASSIYLGADVSAYQRLLPPPPPDNSPAGLADLATVLRLQADRTPEQVSRARQLAAHTPFLMGAAAWGADFTAENLPETTKIFRAIRDQSRPAILAAKNAWSRPRPYQRDGRVITCVPKPRSSSYPSGHSADSALWAAILSAAFPEKAARFEAIVEETMWSRIIGGVHYPTDVQAGRQLGRAIAAKMLASPALQSDLQVMRTEVRARLDSRRAAVHTRAASFVPGDVAGKVGNRHVATTTPQQP